MAAAKEEAFTDAELEVAAILCGLKKTLRARDRRRRRRMQRLQPAPELPTWGRRRPRSMPEEKPATPAPVLPASGVAGRDGAASPDTPLAYPESGGDDATMEEEDAKKPTSHDQWVPEKHGVVSSLSRESAHLLMVKREEEEQARKRPRLAAQGLDLNEPARAPEEEEQARAQAQAVAAAAAAFEYYRLVQQRAAMEKAAVSAGARRRRLEILRAKVACPLVSSRPRRAG
ncbi:uncharacterized protein LOC120654475 isoform X2 [Panicum virgatum]|uniref:Uncharacterized protein n=1 Tax=Panicum virgatum TaxID=38727 RepID=A0A8T0WLG4_PANVG|nr:uncharacterized protein LOC120654475 isoform X2 [Panicum virgatum]KAG2648125.1 hypothetical protein PVAP13_1NG048800 [Panicum virgatum]